MKYVIERKDYTYGTLYGPFDTKEEAIIYAASHIPMPWTLRTLHVILKVENGTSA